MMAAPHVVDPPPMFLERGMDNSPIFLLRDIESSLNKMNNFKPLGNTPALKNPCGPDISRTGCNDVQCLKRDAENLSSPCSQLLLRPPKMMVPEPSPSPASHMRFMTPDMISNFLGKNEQDARPHSDDLMEGETFASFMTSDGDGHTKIISGPIDQVAASMPPELAELARMIPNIAKEVIPDISQFLRSMVPASRLPVRERLPTASIGGISFDRAQPREKEYPTASIGGISFDRAEPPEPEHPTASIGGISFDRPERAEPEYPTASIGGISFDRPESPKSEYATASIGDGPEDISAALRLKNHPCGAEIMECQKGLDHSSTLFSSEVKSCLLDNLEYLSPRCKCFINQVEGPEKMQQHMPQNARPAPAPILKVAGLNDPMFVRDDMRSHRSYSPLPCLFMMGSAFLLVFFVLRSCLQCFCTFSGRTKNVAVVVPPAQTSIKLVEPLRMEDIKQPLAK